MIHKEARTKDGKTLGYIAAEEEECIYVLSSRHKEHMIPKSLVMEFDGSVVLIDLQSGKIGRYKSLEDHGIRLSSTFYILAMLRLQKQSKSFIYLFDLVVHF